MKKTVEFEIKIKMGRKHYTFTQNDRFRDDGTCVDVTTQKGKYQGWMEWDSLVLTKKALSELDIKCNRVPVKSESCSLRAFRYQLR